MLDVARILTGFSQQIGWRQPIDQEYAVVSAANNVSNSGKYFQDYSKSIRVENLKNNFPQGLSDDDFNARLTEKANEGLVRACYDVISDELDLLESKPLYHFQNDFSKKITNVSNRFVGYEVTLAKQEGIAITLNKLMTHFDGVDTFNIYIYHSSQKSPIETISVTTQTDSVKSETTSKILYYQNDIYTGGTFYIGYYQDDLGVQAYDRQYELADIQNCFEFVYVKPIMVDATSGTDIFDVNKVENASESWGLNFDLSVYNDWTQLLLDNKSVMLDAIGYKVAAMLVDDMYYSNRNNSISKEVKQRLLIELKGVSGAKEFGLEAKMDKEIKRVKQVFFPEHLITVQTLT